MHEYIFGVDIGGTTVKLGLFSVQGVLLEKWDIPTRTQDNGSHILPDVSQAILDWLDGHKIDYSQVAGIGIGVPGPVDSKGMVRRCVNLGWGLCDLKAQMNALLPQIPNIAVGNDANVAALGEMRQGSGQGYTHAVMFTLGTGVGGGVVLDGRIIAGTNGAGGEVGHLTVAPEETVPCSCGKCGCLEQYASATGIVRLAKTMLSQCTTPSALRNMDEFSAKTICDLAREGDEMACAILNRSASYLALAMSQVACTVDPQVIIVGGGMSRAGDVLLDAVRKHYVRYAFHANANTPIVMAQLGNDAGIYGCAGLIAQPK